MVKFKITDILATSEGVKNHIEQYNEIPPTANVAGANYLTSQFADVMTRAILQIDSNNFNDIENRPVNFPSTSVENITLSELDLKNYVDLADKVYGATNERMVFPEAGKRDTTYISYMGLVYAFARILTWYKNNKVMPTRVYLKKWTGKPAIGGGSSPNKSQLWLDVEDALGRTFNNDQELCKALQNHPDYELYYNDKKDRPTAIAALKVIGKPGVNCVDVSQVIYYLLIDMGYEDVHICRGDFNCGGHVWVTYSSGKVFDAAGMMKWGYGIGQYMCSGTPRNVNVDPAWLLSDDGIT